ncbi:MAG: tRNA (uridine(34)/cytosine(34)/5-carboxymethylaminomethyluridine(34)-2'-O)-methyltransferase TrmL [Clostridiales bacterium]|nr:tRNA (uridine(34)/cytosine(34)/5-carboxymethylaminomethyluridine(34)-2'-O)-methyltransferase TrmL [Clostridiales bacterium]
MNIVLFEPEIPQNAGNIARTCAATNSSLHLIKPLGFSLEDKYVKRAGLDYWHLVEVYTYEDFGIFMQKNPQGRMHFLSTKGEKSYSEVTYDENDFLIFGSETKGLPESLLERVYPQTIRIPMIEEARSLNISNAVAIVLYEALRQNQYRFLKKDGQLTGRKDPIAPWMEKLSD